ncbi:hypothetical protein WN943_010384 [Citrus x changshan-huyou]
MDAAYNLPRKFMVKLKTRMCDCDYWEIVGLPCQHAMVVIGYARHGIEEYVSTWFTRQAYLNTYSVMFSPLLHQCTWERTGRPLIDPPIVQKKIPSGPCQSSNTGMRKRRAQVGSGDAGIKKRQSSQGLSQSENLSQALNVTGSL